MKKTLYLIGGPMGVGKTTVCRILNQMLPQSVFLDGDWCWNADPFQVTEETKHMVMDNICHVLNNFLACSAYENVVFCWVMDRQYILDDILARLTLTDTDIKCISLLCTPEQLRARLAWDVKQGTRLPNAVERGVERLSLYDTLDTWKINTTGKTAEETARSIVENDG